MASFLPSPKLLPIPLSFQTIRTKDLGNFFGNTGAVAAVFVLVGLAATSIALWILFAIRRRRRQNRLENDASAGAQQAASTHRLPLDDDDYPPQARYSASALELSQHRSSSGLASTLLGPRVSYHDEPDHVEGFNPYADFGYPGQGVPNQSRDGYIPARTGSPPPVAYFNKSRSRRPSASGSTGSASGGEGYMLGSHSTTPSGASWEPLMASYYRQSVGDGQLSGSPTAATPPATAASKPHVPSDDSSQPLVDDREPTETHSAITSYTTDDRMDPGLRQRQKEADSASMKDLKDEEDYSRPVLGVRNLP
ncbi:hypothetical protein NP233_g4843 [Leucocoprinus birnbaumii]|uniref:Uncharacterized protein n=1 Tax=Leucocoprinus birnbaumii TaxID=56174 RepID=A0AAD5VVC6_9AGAR|nr:hypothetical protein NP233_g4843 [Leucocoprinus birnbaumii]